MQAEEFDKKIIEAAENHHPEYDDNAWAKMEKLLNKHLPEKKDDRRRIVFFLLLFLLLGSGVWLGVSKPWQRTASLTTVSKNDQQNISATATGNSGSKETNLQTSATGISSDKDDDVNKTITGAIENIPGDVQTTPRQNTKVTNYSVNKSQQNLNNPLPIIINQSSIKKNAVPLNDNTGVQSTDVIMNEKNSKFKDGLINDNPVAVNVANDNKISESQKQISGNSNTDQKNTGDSEKDPVNTGMKEITKNPDANNKKGKSNFLFLFLSAGPDVSSAATDQLGETKLLVGAGLSYTFRNRFTIKTGFYSAHKVYAATPGEYHPPASFWMYYPNLQKVDADCNVYEIPLLLSYNFGSSTKQNWIATTGLSSYLMKKETYNYLYKNAAGQLTSKKWTYNNEYKHYFSVLTLSGGYQRNLNKTISLMVEPYLKIPLTGIGFGKVKLNSGGILFSVGIKPFGAAKK